MTRSWSHRTLVAALGLAAALAASPALAKKRQQTRPPEDAVIEPLLAQKVGDAVCFAGTFAGLEVNVWDYSKAKQVPVAGLFRFGAQVTRPEPFVHVGQQLTAMTLLLTHEEREVQYEPHKSVREATHDFRLRVSLQGWPAALQAAGECPLGRRVADKAARTTLHCGIDCDGGGMEVERIAGTADVIFRFHAGGGGLRMSGGCSGGQPYHVGGDAKPYDVKLQEARKPVSFRLTPMPAEACAVLRKTTAGGQE